MLSMIVPLRTSKLCDPALSKYRPSSDSHDQDHCPYRCSMPRAADGNRREECPRVLDPANGVAGSGHRQHRHAGGFDDLGTLWR